MTATTVSPPFVFAVYNHLHINMVFMEFVTNKPQEAPQFNNRLLQNLDHES
jgi:cephalosporin-C deacetylase-like acetyl esterase